MPRNANICSPDNMKPYIKCLQCYSTTELKAALVVALAELSGATYQELYDCGACWNCVSDSERLQAFVAFVWYAAFGEFPDAATINEDIRCLRCYSESQLDSAIVCGWCEYAQTNPQ